MNRLLAVILLLAGSIAAANAFGLGLGNQFGRLGSLNRGAAGSHVTNGLLLEDGASFLLLEDGVSNVCLEGGC